MELSSFEKWIEGYEEKYSISTDGRVFSHNYNHTKEKRELKVSIKNGYLQVKLFSDGGKRNYRNIHRLVAETFLTKPKNMDYVNHKDENKTNNTLSNLEWCTQKYNSNYGTRNDKIRKKVYKFDKNGNFLREYESTVCAGKECNIPHQNISSCCRGEIKSAGGYLWKYDIKA